MTTQAKKTYKKSPYAGAEKFTNQELYNIFTTYQNGPLKEYTKKYKELKDKIVEINKDDDMDDDDKKKAKKKINDELKSLKKPKGPMRLDIKNENASEKMKENNARYLAILIKDATGKERPLVRELFGSKSASKCGWGKVDEGKKPTSCNWQTRIRFPYWPGSECTVASARSALKLTDKTEDDELWKEMVANGKITIKGGKFVVTSEFIDALLEDWAGVAVNEKSPDISDDQYDEAVKTQLKLLKGQYLQWQVEDMLDREFVSLLSDEETQEEINWTPTDKQTVEGNIQRGRKPVDGDKAEQALAKQFKEETGRALIPLDEWIVYYRNRIGQDGDLWGKVYDASKPTEKGKPKKLATLKNPETGKPEILNYKTFLEFFRHGSVYTGYMKYQTCISGLAGARLHAQAGEMHVRRAAKGESQAQTSDEQINTLDDFGGQFGDEDEDDVDDEPAPVVKKTDQRTALEKQLASIDADAVDDE